MANNWTRATVTPDLPKNMFATEQIELLEEAGFGYEDSDDDTYYFFVKEYTDDSLEWTEVFECMAHATGKEILIEGCWGCDKLRPGEFGGFVYRITSGRVQYSNTALALEQMRKEPLESTP